MIFSTTLFLCASASWAIVGEEDDDEEEEASLLLLLMVTMKSHSLRKELIRSTPRWSRHSTVNSFGSPAIIGFDLLDWVLRLSCLMFVTMLLEDLSKSGSSLSPSPGP